MEELEKINMSDFDIERPVLSIIIPLYNGEEFIRQTLENVLKIKHKKEVIIVNDGSGDGGVDICYECQNNNHEIVIINQNNGGICAARNTGIDNAKGLYCVFVDQDDLIVPETVDMAIDEAIKNRYDLIFWSTERLMPDQSTVKCDTVLNEMVINTREDIHQIIKEMLFNYNNKFISYIGHVWAGMYKTDVIRRERISFKRFVDIEDDYLFVFDFLCACSTVKMISKLGYYWRYNIKSETYRLKKIDQFDEKNRILINYITKALRENGFEEEIINKYNLYASQRRLVSAVENDCRYIRFSIKDLVLLKRDIKKNASLVKMGLLIPFESIEKRRKRIWWMLRRKLYSLSFGYVFFDSLYRGLKIKICNSDR